MPRRSVVFTAPYQVAVLEEPEPEPLPNQLMVQTLFSGISSGTECMIYRGQFPDDMPIDVNISALQGSFSYPLRYGYATVGRVVDTGLDVDHHWLGQLVFGFQPHTSLYCADPDKLIPIPTGVTPQQAVFLPNMETAVNLVMDGRPMIGEHVLVFGQGIVGLLTTALLSQHPLGALVTLDKYSVRREFSLKIGAQLSLDPGFTDVKATIKNLMPAGADLAYELSGLPQTLNDVIALTGFDGRVIIGSWYGQKHAELDLGGRFHRSRIRLISSQVSSIAPEFLGRWTKTRRFEVAWKMMQIIQPENFITHRIPITEAPQAYRLLDQQTEDVLQIILTYPGQ